MTQSGDSMLGFTSGDRKGRSGRDTRRRTERVHTEPPSLREIALFSKVDDTTLSRLSLEAKIENFEEGDAIFRQGDAATAVVLVLHGYVKMLRMASNGDETLIGIRCNGQTISDPPVGNDETYCVSAEAVGAVQALKLPASRFARMMKELPALCAAVLKDARDNIASLVFEIELLKAQNADQRLARFLLGLCPPNIEQCRFRLPYDKRLIAAQLGVKQETLSRAFAKLRDYGVRTETRDVLIESVSRLEKECDQLGRASSLTSERAEAARNDAA